MFSKKATKFKEIFTVDLTLCSKCQIAGEDFASFCGLLRKHELYPIINEAIKIANLSFSETFFFAKNQLNSYANDICSKIQFLLAIV